ncbi:MAG: hypothetical protein DME11_22885 [Candidatus Rokuibacteriota bacterium]|nr:MAG: hypothetical protein DMD80_16260 [Candidatus Rokubacteria bacterium]PYM61564.1 MAG: hypothetical protein DME11_22885 [Candidatus Rokubacteria bacterium]
MPFTPWFFGIAILTLAGAGCATTDSPSAQPVAVDSSQRTTLDCLNLARRVRQTYDGRPQMTIDQDRYQQCLREQRQSSQAPAR